ncbi:FERM, RhoGEF and pleckstrin domain protein 2 [Paragonimus westermani]|uniref:FERM, RhoGEF and pleckstrin domain protein 2 n=1 Tax=Paragonimus westermani TaxID=34504 RepID=A0A5J4P3J1_9TREM|nr:FERM, RhoGEF and pleckstrin domain protein 2 [Paragonimus westermani]
MVQKSEEKCSSSVARDAPMDVSVISLDDNMELFQVKEYSPGHSSGSWSFSISTVYLFLFFLDLWKSYQGSCMGRELFQLVVQKMGLFDFQYFDLAYLDVEGNHCWLDHSKLLMKIAKSLNQTTLEFVFSVKYYIPHPHLLVNDHTRYLFALQIKRDFFRGLLHSNRNTSLLLAAFIVQSELGDYVETECKSYAYLRRHHLLRSAPDSYLMRVMELHQTLAGLTKADADFRLLDAARKVELYGVRLHPVKGYIKDTVEFSFLSQAACKNFWKKCIEQHSFFRSSTQIWNGTADRQRSQLPFNVNRTGSFPSLKRLRRSVSFEGNVASHSSVCQTPKHDDSDTVISSGHTSQVSTPLRRLVRLRNRALSLK